MNLAFPLLRRLVEAGDPIARRVFKEEIAERFGSGYLNTIIYLIENGYLDYFTGEELRIFLGEVHPTSKALLQGFINDNPDFRELILKFLKILSDFGNDFIITHIKEFIKKLDSYELVNLVSSIMDQMERKSISTFISNNAKSIIERIIEILVKDSYFNWEITGSLKNLYQLNKIIFEFLPQKETINNLKALNYFSENFASLLENLKKGVMGNWEFPLDQLKYFEISETKGTVLVLDQVLKRLISLNGKINESKSL